MNSYGSTVPDDGRCAGIDENEGNDTVPLVPGGDDASLIAAAAGDRKSRLGGDAPALPGYLSASAWSRLTFGWFRPLLALGNSKPQLDPSDLRMLPLLPDCSTAHVRDAFDRSWTDELSRRDKSDKKEPSLFRALLRAFGKQFVQAGLLKFVHDSCIFVGPQVLHGMVVFLKEPEAPLRRGIFLTLAVMSSQLTMSFCLRHYFFICYLTGLKVRTAVVTAVYRKALVLSPSERQRRTAGEITNLISVDAQRMQDLTTYLHAVWYSFLQIGLALYFLWGQLGPSCLGGIVVIVIMMPVTKSVAQLIGGMQKRLMEAKDARVEMNNEVLGSMRVVKLQAWETPFQLRILRLRKAEMIQLRRYVIATTFSVMLWSAVPLLVALATFATYTILGNKLEVASALTSLALFEILRFPLFMLPQVINRIVEASVSFDRVRSFLLCNEHRPISPGSLSRPGVWIANASFAYEGKKPRPNAMEKKRSRVAFGREDIQDEEILDVKWEVSLLRERLADAEMHIRELLHSESDNDDDMGGSDSIGMVELSDDGEDIQTSPSLRNNTNTPPQRNLCLHRIDFSCRPGEFVAVVGGVGSGKSSFVNSVLGEVRPVCGDVFVKGTFSYFAQTPFIMNDSVRSNVIFSRVGVPFNETKYRRAIRACALTRDLAALPSADATEIGEKGITLSGGQKARVSMARVVYNDADLYLLDDPLAAVDAHVGKHLFQECIVNELLCGTKGAGGSMVILITNAIQYLSHPRVDRIVVLRDGFVAETGTYEELSGRPGSLFSSFLSVVNETSGVGGSVVNETSGAGGPSSILLASKAAPAGNGIVTSSSRSSLSELGDNTDAPEIARILSPWRPTGTRVVPENGNKCPSSPLQRPETNGRDDKSSVKNDKKSSDEPIEVDRLMTDEYRERAVGHVDKKIYLAWARAAGGVWVGCGIVLMYGIVEGITVCSKWWLTYWSEHGEEDQMFFLTCYTIINLSAIVATFVRVVFLNLAGLRAARRLFSRMLDVVLQTPMSFFDTTPIGRIVNRFSKDIYTIDEQLTTTLRSYLATIVSVLSTIIVISGVTPLFTLCLVPILIFYIIQQHRFAKTYRELKRLDSVSRSPIYALLGETLEGVGTIRAFDAQSSLMGRVTSMMDRQQNAYFLTCTAQCWLAVRLELAGTLIIAFACACGVFEHGRRGGDENFAGLAGLSISFALSVTQSLNWSVRMGSDLEAHMVAVERIEEYCQLPSEAPRVTALDHKMNKNWALNGAIDFVGIKLRYRPALPLVLKGLDLHIPARCKVGVVGRTGAGKSTLMVALQRIVELDSGKILINGVNIRSMGLARLRSGIAVVPQDPVLFAGSVRSNIDPFDEFPDEKLYEVLGRVGLFSSTNSIERNLSCSRLSLLANKRQYKVVETLADEVFEGGSNFSVGQRQLLVIARALLCGAHVVIMDEATAAVDADTDARIQALMRTEFRDATCITVAHRLNTIMDSDLILLMDDGRAVEFDRPEALLESGGMFKELVEAWEKEKE